MTDDPFLTLLAECLNLMHPRFATAGVPPERSFRFEFYHQFRHLWGKALPVQLGLGHVVVQAEPEPPAGPAPDFLFWQLGERGEPDRRLGAVSLALLTNPTLVDDSLLTLARWRKTPAYPHAVLILVGREADIPVGGLPAAPGVTSLFFDTGTWTAVV